MQTYLYIEINVFAFIVLLLIYFNMYHKTDAYLTEQKLFITILLLNMLNLISDTLMWSLDGINTPFNRIFIIFITVIYFILQPIICMFWTIYVDFQINRNSNRIKRMLIPMIIPLIAVTLIDFLSIFYNLIYFFDSINVYHRGKYFAIFPILSLTYIIYTLLYLLINRKKISKTFFQSFISFSFPPIIGAIVQAFIYGLPLIATGMTISILIIYINIQNEQMYKDHLTGLFNRRQLDLYLQDLHNKDKNKVAGILLDINTFKNINDRYGHFAGDEALKSTSYLLRKSFKSKSFISRFGGDEFVILLEVKNKSELDLALEEFRKNTQQYNSEKNLSFDLEYSIGADLYSENSDMTGKDFINYIDSLMYREKQINSKQQRI